jgi:hypothetical protein
MKGYIMKAQDFWTQTPLKAINKLMDQTFSYSVEVGGELAEAYLDDLRDFKKAVTLFRNSDGEAIAELIDEMDTAPREELVMAFATDCGNDFVKSYFGWEVA